MSVRGDLVTGLGEGFVEGTGGMLYVTTLRFKWDSKCLYPMSGLACGDFALSKFCKKIDESLQKFC